MKPGCLSRDFSIYTFTSKVEGGFILLVTPNTQRLFCQEDSLATTETHALISVSKGDKVLAASVVIINFNLACICYQ